MPEPSVPAWFVLKTKPRAERLVSSGLADRGLTTYFPLIPRHISPWRQSQRRLRSDEALFPGYVFVQMDLASQDIIQARSYPGVSYILNQDNTPVPVSSAIVQAIRERADQNWLRVRSQQMALRPGDPVRISDGPFAGMDAIFDHSLSGTERCQVLLALIHRVVPVVLPYGALEMPRAAG